jgi:hypothetical protein
MRPVDPVPRACEAQTAAGGSRPAPVPGGDGVAVTVLGMQPARPATGDPCEQ